MRLNLSYFAKEHLLLALMLLLLHATIWGDFGSALSRSMMLSHLGLFLLWQPLLRGDKQLDRQSAAIFVLVILAMAVWLNWLFVFIWLLLLIGLVGGRVLTSKRERYAYLITLVALISELLIGCITHMFDIPLGKLGALLDYGLLVPPLLLLFIPAESKKTYRPQPVDFLHGLTLSMLVTILALGSLLVMNTYHVPYTMALFQTLFVIAMFLFTISWLLVPHVGFSGLGQLWARYLLNVGTPFEQWLTGLSQVARQYETPNEFAEAAMGRLEQLPWVAGVRWVEQDHSNLQGEETPYPTTWQGENLEVVIYNKWEPGPTLMLHGKLLAQIVTYFYSAKHAQRKLARQAHLQAIYETGARVTHDIKNLLQSLHTMSVMVQKADDQHSSEVQQMLQRQFPHITGRLQLALDKLQSPDGQPATETRRITYWWAGLKLRHKMRHIDFNTELESDPVIPLECLDSVAENLLENARLKRQSQPGITITVTISSSADRIALRVCDTGRAVEPSIVQGLFQEPVESDNGLGVGLYQAARLAEQSGLELKLANNEDGKVCFELSGTIQE